MRIGGVVVSDGSFLHHVCASIVHNGEMSLSLSCTLHNVGVLYSILKKVSQPVTNANIHVEVSFPPCGGEGDSCGQ